MKGNNKLEWNEATMIEAVQEYLNKRYTPHVHVESVKAGSNNYAPTFMVSVVEVDPKETPCAR